MTLIIVLEIVLLGGLFFAAIRANARRVWNAKTLAYAGLAIALSFALSFIRLFRMPQGGSVTPGSMLPILFFSAAFGVGPGLTVGFVYGILQYLQGGWFLNVWQFLLDYILAYAALGIAGIYRKFPVKQLPAFAVSIVAAVIVRIICATLAGYMFWDTAIAASLIYNGTYLIPETVICLILALPLHDPVMKILKNADRR